MKAAAQASPSKDLKLKDVVEVAPSDDEETYSGLVFKRRRKATAKHFASNGRAPSPQAQLPPANSPPSRDIAVQESARAPVGGLWDPNLDAPTYLEKTLLSAEVKEKLEHLEEDQLVEQATRQLGQALAAHYLRGWKGSAKEEFHKAVELTRRVVCLEYEASKFHQAQEESRALLTPRNP